MKRYGELHAKSNFSFLEGASHPDELVRRAGELNYAAVAITDRNSLAGVVRAHAAAKDLGVKLLIGAEIHPQNAPAARAAGDGSGRLRPARPLDNARQTPGEKGLCHITFDDISQYAEGLIAAIVPKTTREPDATDGLPGYGELFAERCYLLAELHQGPDDQRKLGRLIFRLARRRHTAGGCWRRALPRCFPGGVARRVGGRSPRPHGGPVRRVHVSQRPAPT